MRRREFITLLGATVVSPSATLAQQAGRTYRLGVLFPPTRADSPGHIGFFDELRRGGFIEGQNLTVEYRAYGQHVDLITQYANELATARVQLVEPDFADTINQKWNSAAKH